ncbi:unnamed protein product [Toxocara canis]|uniref:Variable large protein n=1 Tax=Toxocara canis TaxID=6265 RepID=A0A183VDB2_TOXCA|nr:unnamed protein product [Toxocara canis]
MSIRLAHMNHHRIQPSFAPLADIVARVHKRFGMMAGKLAERVANIVVRSGTAGKADNFAAKAGKLAEKAGELAGKTDNSRFDSFAVVPAGCSSERMNTGTAALALGSSEDSCRYEKQNA